MAGIWKRGNDWRAEIRRVDYLCIQISVGNGTPVRLIVSAAK